jgi:hypothetical protein
MNPENGRHARLVGWCYAQNPSLRQFSYSKNKIVWNSKLNSTFYYSKLKIKKNYFRNYMLIWRVLATKFRTYLSTQPEESVLQLYCSRYSPLQVQNLNLVY